MLKTLVVFDQTADGKTLDDKNSRFVIQQDETHTLTIITADNGLTFEETRKNNGQFVRSFHHSGDPTYTYHGVTTFLSSVNGNREIVDVDYENDVQHGYYARYSTNQTGNGDMRDNLVELTKYSNGERDEAVELDLIDWNKVDITESTVLGILGRKMKSEAKL